jgi:hypothetical protein
MVLQSRRQYLHCHENLKSHVSLQFVPLHRDHLNLVNAKNEIYDVELLVFSHEYGNSRFALDFNKAPWLEDVWGNGGTTSHIRNFGTKWRREVSFMTEHFAPAETGTFPDILEFR